MERKDGYLVCYYVNRHQDLYCKVSLRQKDHKFIAGSIIHTCEPNMEAATELLQLYRPLAVSAGKVQKNYCNACYLRNY